MAIVRGQVLSPLRGWRAWSRLSSPRRAALKPLARARVVAAISTLVAAMAAVPSRADSASPAMLSGVNVINGTGNTAIAVTIPRPFSIDPAHAGFDLHFTGSWAAFAVVSGRPGDNGRGARYRLGAIQLPPPAGCADAGRVCVDRRGLVLPSFAPQAIQNSGSTSAPHLRYGYPAGPYVIYLLAGASQQVSLRWTLGAPSPHKSLHATRHVKTWFTYQLAPGGSTIASMTGQTRQRLSRPGQVVDWTWAAYGHGPVQIDRQSLCLETGSTPPALPVPRGDYCFWADNLYGLPEGAVFGRYCVPCSDREGNAGSNLDGVSPGVSRSGVEAVVTSADYTVSYSIRILASSPQTGRAFLAWEYLD